MIKRSPRISPFLYRCHAPWPMPPSFRAYPMFWVGLMRDDALQHMQQLAPRNARAQLLGTRWATEASSELLIPKVAEADLGICT